MGNEKKCERCGAMPSGFKLLDYCAECSRDLCDACMKKGCCGHVPAPSGSEQDFGDELVESREPPDPENIYGLASIRQSIEDDRK